MNQTNSSAASATTPCSALDCVEWLRVFRMRYDRATEDGHLETIEALEYIFDALWDGYGGECSRRWCDLIGAPREDGRKVLNQEVPYQDLWTWARSQNADVLARGGSATPSTLKPQ